MKVVTGVKVVDRAGKEEFNSWGLTKRDRRAMRGRCVVKLNSQSPEPKEEPKEELNEPPAKVP
eukprot:2353161-Amphidinium_carterae.1